MPRLSFAKCGPGQYAWMTSHGPPSSVSSEGRESPLVVSQPVSRAAASAVLIRGSPARRPSRRTRGYQTASGALRKLENGHADVGDRGGVTARRGDRYVKPVDRGRRQGQQPRGSEACRPGGLGIDGRVTGCADTGTGNGIRDGDPRARGRAVDRGAAEGG